MNPDSILNEGSRRASTTRCAVAEQVAAGHPSPRVAARQAEARRRVLAAARVVVSEHGFAAAQVAVVASVADVATGSIYRHFPSKAALFSEMLRVVCVRELDVVTAIASETGRNVT